MIICVSRSIFILEKFQMNQLHQLFHCLYPSSLHWTKFYWLVVFTDNYFFTCKDFFTNSDNLLLALCIYTISISNIFLLANLAKITFFRISKFKICQHNNFILSNHPNKNCSTLLNFLRDFKRKDFPVF